jgi:hypothetical protein
MNITLKDKSIHTIRFYGGYVMLDKNNPKPGACRDCDKKLETGEGVYRHAYMGIGYICFPCLRSELLVRTYDLGFPNQDAGFHFSEISHTISQCYSGFPQQEFTTFEVIDAIRREWKYEIVERSLGPDGAATGKIDDASDSIQAGF